VFFPAISARVIKSHKLASRRVEGGNVAPFVAVAEVTGKSSILWIACSSMLATDDMVDLVRETGVRECEQTILTSIEGA